VVGGEVERWAVESRAGWCCRGAVVRVNKSAHVDLVHVRRAGEFGRLVVLIVILIVVVFILIIIIIIGRCLL